MPCDTRGPRSAPAKRRRPGVRKMIFLRTLPVQTDRSQFPWIVTRTVQLERASRTVELHSAASSQQRCRMMLPRLSRVLSSSSKGFYPLTMHLHDGVCFVLRSRPREGADDGRYGFVHGPPTGALTLTLANHPALVSRLDEETFEDLRDAYAHKATIAEDTVIDWRSGGGGQSFFEKLSERFSAREAGVHARRTPFSISTRRRAA